MQYLIEIFGGISLSTAIIFIAAIGFVIALLVKAYKFIVKNHDEVQDKEQMLLDIKEELIKIQNKQSEMEKNIDTIKNAQITLTQKQEKFEARNRSYELNRLRDNLLQSYRYYTSEDRNPLQAWSEMEKDAFDKLFQDYEERGGDGFMHSTVEPAMASLNVIQMNDTEGFIKLMRSRKG